MAPPPTERAGDSPGTRDVSRRGVLETAAGICAASAAVAVAGTGSAEAAAANAELFWQSDTDYSLRGGPTVVDGQVYATGAEPDTSEPALLAFDPATGEVAWTHEEGSVLEVPPQVVGGEVFAPSVLEVTVLDAATGAVNRRLDVGGVPLFSPTVAGRTAFTSVTDALVATDATTGEERWRFERDDDATFVTPPTFEDGTVLAATMVGDGPEGSALHAVDASTGDEQWRYEPDGEAVGTPAATADRVFVTADRRPNADEGALHAVDASTGDREWRLEPDAEDTFRGSPPTVAGGRVFVNIGPNLYAVDSASGEVLWEQPTGVTSVPTVAGDRAFAASSSFGGYVGLRADSGATVWEFAPADGGFVDLPATVDDGVLYGFVEGSGGNNELVALNAGDVGSRTDSHVLSGTGRHTDAWAETSAGIDLGFDDDPNGDPNNGTGDDPNNGTGDDPSNGTSDDPSNGTSDDPSNGTGDDPSDGAGSGDDGSEIPGFGVAGALAGISGAGYLLKRRLGASDTGEPRDPD